MNSSRAIVLLVVIVSIALFFRTYHLTLTPPGLYPDEAMNGNNALEALRGGGFKIYYPENNGREGLFINIQAFFLKLLLPLNQNQPEAWMLRLPSALFGTLTVLGLYFLGKELFGRETGLLASFLVATSFWHILFSRIGFRAIMAPLLLTWSLYFILSAIREGKEGRPRRVLWFAALGGVIYGLGFYTYIAYRVTPLLFLLFIPFFRKEKNFWRTIAVFAASAVILALPLGIYYLENPADFLGRTSQISIFSSETPLKDLALNTLKTLGMFHLQGDSNWRHNYAGSPQLATSVGVLFLLGIIIGIAQLRKGPAPTKFSLLLIFGWFVLASLPVVVSNEGLPHALRAILMIPPTFLLAGIGGAHLYETLKRYVKLPWLRGLAAAFLVFLALQAYVFYFIRWARNPETYGAFSAPYANLAYTLRTLPQETSKYVVVRAGGVSVKGIPMPAQTVMYLTDTYNKENQRKKNIYYILPEEENSLPSGAGKFYLQ